MKEAVSFRSLYESPFHYALANPVVTGQDISFYAELAAGKTCLEVGCGSGRVTIPMARRATGMAAIDPAPAMLAQAEASARTEGLEIDFRQQSGSEFRFGRTFDLIVMPFNVIQHIPAREIEACLENVKRHLAPEGRFAFDTINLAWHGLDRTCDVPEQILEGKDPEGRVFVLSQRVRFDARSGICKLVFTFVFSDGSHTEFQVTLSNLPDQEVEALLAKNGYRILERRGDWHGSSLPGESAVSIFLASHA